MPDKKKFFKAPSKIRLDAARRHNKYNLELGELGKEVADRLKEYCAERQIFADVDRDEVEDHYKISIYEVNLTTIEEIEAILGKTQVS